MDVPIKFPNDAAAIAEEVARYRSLSPEERVRALGEMFRLHQFLRKSSGRQETTDRTAVVEEELARNAIKAFVARHG